MIDQLDLMARLTALELEVQRLRTSHRATHELSGGDEVRLATQNSGTPLNRYRSLNFSTGLTAVEDSDGQRVTITASGLGRIFGTRSVQLNNPYQPSATRDVLITFSVTISTGVAGDGKVELLVDASNPPTTVVATARVGTALTVVTFPFTALVKAAYYYEIKTTSTAGAPTFTLL